MVFADDVAKALVFGEVEGGKVGLAHGLQLGSDGVQALLGFGHGDDFAYFGVQALYSSRRGTDGQVDAVPSGDFYALDAAFCQGGHIGQLCVARGGGDGQSTQFAAFDVGDGRGHGVKTHMHLAADQIDQGGGAALVGDVGDLNARRIFKHFGGNVLGAAGAAAGEVGVALASAINSATVWAGVWLLTTRTLGTEPT